MYGIITAPNPRWFYFCDSVLYLWDPLECSRKQSTHLSCASVQVYGTEETTERPMCVCVCLHAFRGTWLWHPETLLCLTHMHPFITPHLFLFVITFPETGTLHCVSYLNLERKGAGRWIVSPLLPKTVKGCVQSVGVHSFMS